MGVEISSGGGAAGTKRRRSNRGDLNDTGGRVCVQSQSVSQHLDTTTGRWERGEGDIEIDR